VAEIVSYLSRHLVLRRGDLIAWGTPARLATPPGPDRRLRPGDRVTCWIEGIGELTTTIGSNEEHAR
jgi:2-keto-4-pentenoate hydratase/2-oxohepta-3-ene-1,7-dioic acid hydratase in catechol pathway